MSTRLHSVGPCCLALALSVTVSAAMPANPGKRPVADLATLKRGFAEPDMLYAPFIFWFWDEPLRPEKMAEMATVMASQRFNPGYAHARHEMVKAPGLQTEQWLSDTWFRSFAASLDAARKAHSYLGYCDEYWWPSFQAAGRVLASHPELKAESLSWATIDAAAGAVVEVPPSFFAVAARLDEALPATGQAGPDRPIPVGSWIWHPTVDGTSSLHRPRTIRSATLQAIGSGPAFTWHTPRDLGTGWRVYAFNKYSHPGVDGGQVNCLDERLAPAFIKIALEPYASRFAGQMGKAIPGDFIDHEGDYGWRLAWSADLDRQYLQRYGRDIRLWMPLMVDDDAEGLAAKARWEWFDLVSDLYCSQFKAVTDWHERRGMYTTAHVWEESLLAQAYAVGDHMKFLRSLTMPGQDCLGRKALRIHDFKEIESVAEFEGSRAATELMGAGGFEGAPWGTFTPAFLKQAANAVVAWGMSQVIPHGVFTVRKLDGNPWPPDWYNENPMFPTMHLWTDFVRRSCYVNSHGRAAADVLLYNPIESVWALTDHALFDAARPASGLVWLYPEDRPNGRRANQIERIYTKAIQDLTDSRVEFLVFDRHYLDQMEVRSGTLVRQGLVFKTVVLPDMLLMSHDGARKILEFCRAGGRVYSLGVLPYGSPEGGLNDAEMKRSMDALRNLPTFTQCPVEPAGQTGTWQYGPGWLPDPNSGALGLRPLLDAGAPGLESHVRFSEGGFPMLQRHVRIAKRDFFWLVNNTDQWQQADLRVSASGAAEIWDCEDGSIHPVRSNPTQRTGEVSVKAVLRPFEAYWLVFDPSRRPGRPAEMSIPRYETVLTLSGPWHVTCDPKLQPEMEHPTAPPAGLASGEDKPLEDWKAWGLERFSGLMDYEKTFRLDAKGAMVLDLGQVNHVAEVWLNGKQVASRMWGPHVFDVTSAARRGENRLRVRVANLINNSYGDVQPSGLLGPVTIRKVVP